MEGYHLNTLHLKYIVEVAKTGSITLAAKNLYMNQPNLSKAIKELETNVGIDIFKRTSKGIVPTKKGEEFLSYAKNILAQVEEMEALYKTDQKNKITFSLSAPRASYISHAFTMFIEKMDKTKELDINYKETNSMKTIKKVAEDEFHLGIIRCQKNHESYFLNFLSDKGLKFETIWEFECLILMSKDSPLAALESISYNELNKYIEIIHGDLTIPYLSSTEAVKNENEKYQKRRIYVYERGGQFDLLNQITDSYMWVSPLPQKLLERYGMIQRKCNAGTPLYRDILIYQKGYQLTSLDKEFINEVNNVKAGLMKG
jgi:DNA-binding transcriptional LysR family regulator